MLAVIVLSHMAILSNMGGIVMSFENYTLSNLSCLAVDLVVEIHCAGNTGRSKVRLDTGCFLYKLYDFPE